MITPLLRGDAPGGRHPWWSAESTLPQPTLRHVLAQLGRNAALLAAAGLLGYVVGTALQ